MDNDEFHIMTIQPYVVLETGEFNQHIMATMGISHFYSYKGSKEKDSVVQMVPDGCSNILFSYKDGECRSKFLGNNTQATTLTIEKDTDYFGIRFQPGENPCFSDLNVKEFVGKEMDLTEFPAMTNLYLKMAQEDTFTSRMCTFMEEYRNIQKEKVSTQHRLFRQIIRLIVKKKGLLKISELVVLTGYSSRYLNQIFEDYAGMSAKQFCNLVKLHMLTNDLDNQKVDSFAGLAADYNYYDMAHFIHDFKNFSGTTPGKYLNEIKEKNYRSLVKNV